MNHKCDGCRFKGEHQEMMFRPFGVCTKERNLAAAVAAYDAKECPHKENKKMPESETARAEAIKEFAEKIYRSCAMYGQKDKLNKTVFLNIVDQIAKEMGVEL